MKYITRLACALLLFLAIPQGSQSQVLMSLIFGDKLNSEEMAFGMHIDYGWNNLTNLGDTKSHGSLNLGLFLGYKLHDKWTLNADLLAKLERGATHLAPYSVGDRVTDSLFMDGMVTRRLQYLGLPLSIQYAVSGPWYIETGPTIELCFKARDVFEVDTDQGKLDLDHGIGERTANWNIGWQAGTGVRTKKGAGPSVGLRYVIGFTDTDKLSAGTQANRGLSMYVNFTIGRAKALAKAREKEAAGN